MRNVLEQQAQTPPRRQPRHRRQQQYIRGTHRGQFFRIKVPTEDPSVPFRLPKLRNHASPMMRPFVDPTVEQQAPHTMSQLSGHSHSPPVEQSLATGVETTQQQQQQQHYWRKYWQRAKEWFQYNYGVLILNFGSVCSLLAFTRSDVLELRALSVTGSLSSVMYTATLPAEQRSLTPLVWGMCFVLVNGLKIRDILEERRAVVQFANAQQEAIYQQHFQPHGVTPKQFEYIAKRARTIRLNRGDVLVREGAPVTRVFLVIQGQTRAHHLGRRLTAVSFVPTDLEVAGGSAWVGEMAFLEQYWHKETPKGETPVKGPRRFTHRHTERAMYTISAVEDNTIILAWKHADMEALLEKSSDLRTALTRAMTAAIVGKVVAFTASKKAAASPSSSTTHDKPSWWRGFRAPLRSHETVPPIKWIEEEEEEEDLPKKVKIDRKPTFGVPEN